MTVAGAYAKIESHEEICVLRHNTINEKLDDLKSDAKTLRNLGITVLLALLAWMGGQLFMTATAHPTAVSQALAPK